MTSSVPGTPKELSNDSTWRAGQSPWVEETRIGTKGQALDSRVCPLSDPGKPNYRL